jgi:hypothetical protein
MLLSIGKMIQNYGVTGMLKLLRDWDVLDPTDEDIDSLYDRVSKPSEQFNDDSNGKFDW